MTEPFIFLRTVVPLVVMFVSFVACSFLRKRIQPRERGFLISFWGCLGLVLLGAAVVSCFLRLAESATIAAGNAGFNAVLGMIAALLLVLSLVLARWVRVRGQPTLSVLFRPPPDITYRALHGWPVVPVATRFFTAGIETFSGTYALTNWPLSPAGWQRAERRGDAHERYHAASRHEAGGLGWAGNPHAAVGGGSGVCRLHGRAAGTAGRARELGW